ncbi:MAG: CRISPR-associated endonuclease Cas3'', partial [Oscillospiraceae bacterium]|nr:CRISPR-associated endonuclease Cas3'' [Oscillospiraceae bacterium]
MFTAHIDNQRTESVAEHSLKAAERAAAYAEKLNLSASAKLQGLLHDLGKLCVDFDNYINGRNSMKRGEIDHAYAGARYLCELSKETDDGLIKIAAGYISRTIISHHGLHDWLYDDGSSYFEHRISTEKRYDEILENIHDIITRENALGLLKSAAAEIEEYDKMMKRLSSKNSMKYLFYCSLFERLMQSV